MKSILVLVISFTSLNVFSKTLFEIHPNGKPFEISVVLRSKSFMSGESPAEQAAADALGKASYDVNSSQWTSESRSTELSWPFFDPTRNEWMNYIDHSVVSATASPATAISGGMHQYEGVGTVQLKLPTHPMDLGRTKVLVVPERLDPYDLNWSDEYTAPRDYVVNCQKWHADLDYYAANSVLYSNCEEPKVTPACCANLYVSGFATAAILTFEKTDILIDEVQTPKIPDTDKASPGADLKRAKKELDKIIEEWKQQKEKQYGYSLAYAYCGPEHKTEYSQPGYTRLASRCTAITQELPAELLAVQNNSDKTEAK
jgi:hypothetical protein